MNTITVTEKTTLGELLSILDLAEKSGKTPTPKELFETAGDPIAETNDCTLFSNGFAIYQNITGRTVVWLPYCKSFTFYFNKLRDSEKDTFRESYELPDGFLAAQPWILAVTLIGDHRIEANSMNRTGSRKTSQGRRKERLHKRMRSSHSHRSTGTHTAEPQKPRKPDGKPRNTDRRGNQG